MYDGRHVTTREAFQPCRIVMLRGMNILENLYSAHSGG